MKTITPEEETRLRDVIGGIGGVIEDRYATGQGALLEPRSAVRTPGWGVRVSVAAVAVTDHDGVPGVYAPGADGRYRWSDQPSIAAADARESTVTEIRAWSDGEVIRFLEKVARDCQGQPTDPSDAVGAQERLCVPATYQLASYQPGAAGDWQGGLFGIDPAADVLGVGGPYALVLSDQGFGARSLQVLDDAEGVSTGLPNHFDTGTRACASGDAFVFAEPTGDDVSFTLFDPPVQDDVAPGSPGYGETSGPRPDTREVPFTGDEQVLTDAERVTVLGCGNHAVIVEAGDDTTGTLIAVSSRDIVALQPYGDGYTVRSVS